MQQQWPSVTLTADFTGTDGRRLSGYVDVQLLQPLTLSDGSGLAMPAGRLADASRELVTEDTAQHSYEAQVPVPVPGLVQPEPWMLLVYVVFYGARDSELRFLCSAPDSPGYLDSTPGSTVSLQSLQRFIGTTFPGGASPGTPGGGGSAGSGVTQVQKVPGGLRVSYADGRTTFLPLVESTKDVAAALAAHIAAERPHATYDNTDDLTLMFENSLI